MSDLEAFVSGTPTITAGLSAEERSELRLRLHGKLIPMVCLSRLSQAWYPADGGDEPDGYLILPDTNNSL